LRENIFECSIKILKEKELNDLSKFFKALGDSTRLKILLTLLNSEMCVNDLVSKLNITESTVSHQLQILRINKLVKKYRKGKNIFYSPTNNYVYTIIAQAKKNIFYW